MKKIYQILIAAIIILMLILANNKNVMGKYTNGWFDNFFGSLAVVILIVAIFGLFRTF